MACDRGCEGVVRYLASLPAVDISRPTHRGWTPLITAACRGHAGITACLLEELGADASAATLEGRGAGCCAELTADWLPAGTGS